MADLADARKPRILVVDDSSLVRLYYQSTLDKAGFAVEHALNGIEAMERVLERPFDLLIVDVNMPRMDGFTFVRALRRGGVDTAAIPVLMISTEAESQDKAEALMAGANFYLVKPVAEAELIRHVRALTGAAS